MGTLPRLVRSARLNLPGQETRTIFAAPLKELCQSIYGLKFNNEQESDVTETLEVMASTGRVRLYNLTTDDSKDLVPIIEYLYEEAPLEPAPTPATPVKPRVDLLSSYRELHREPAETIEQHDSFPNKSLLDLIDL